MSSRDFIRLGQTLVAGYFNKHRDATDTTEPLKPEDVYTVCYSKTLQNSKGLFSTPVSDGMYYEITYNGDDDVVYFDAYKKWDNFTIFKPHEFLNSDEH